MTIEELRVLVTDIAQKTRELNTVTTRLGSFIRQIEHAIAAENPFSGAINVDQFVSIQAPLYLALLTELEVAADALGTDPLN